MDPGNSEPSLRVSLRLVEGPGKAVPTRGLGIGLLWAGVGLERLALTGARIHDAQDAYNPSRRQTIDGEVHRLLLVGSCQTRFRRPLTHQPLALAPPHGKTPGKDYDLAIVRGMDTENWSPDCEWVAKSFVAISKAAVRLD